MTAYLRFGLNGARYGVEAGAVQEIVKLAELAPADEAPPYIAGLVNLRGRITPVMNLDLRLGHPLRRYHLSDSIIVLQAQATVMGIIVNEVSDVVEIADASIEPLPHYDDASPAHIHFLFGNARVGETIVMLLDVSRLLHASVPEPGGRTFGEQACFCPDATEQEHAIFHQRALALMQPVGDQKSAVSPLSLVQLGGELFGVELGLVREFAHLHRVTPIPCCPPHISGNMNLRGDILTLVDIRGLLNVPESESSTAVMVVESGELLVGVPVEQVLEVVYTQAADIIPLPAAIHEDKGEFCKGALHHGDGMVSVLDMQKILTRGGLEVEQEA